ncbi:MAG: hypothetical protein D6757_06875, partial [Alphaproteobacteria bacterium]
MIPVQGLPRPDNLADVLNYRRPMPRVAFYWQGADLWWQDGRAALNAGDCEAWMLYTEHPRIRPFFAPYQWHDDDPEKAGPTFLLLDRRKNRVAVGPVERKEQAIGRAPYVPLDEAPYLHNLAKKDLEHIMDKTRNNDPVL